MLEQRMTVFVSSYRGNERNAFFPHKRIIQSEQDLLEATKFDHVCAEYRNNHRANNDFIRSDCLPLDLDNSHTEDPSGWKSLESIQEAFPGVAFYAVPSRNHMKPKDGKVPRPKYHLYFPITEMTDAGRYKQLKHWIYSRFPYFDDKALDSARHIYGVEDPQVYRYPGSLTVDAFMPWSDTPIPEGKKREALHAEGEELENQLFQLPEIIPTGERNDTLFRYGCQLRAAGRNREEISVLLNYQNEQHCDNPIEQEELDTIINQVCRYEMGRTATQDLIEAAAGFKEAAAATVNNALPVTCLADLTERSPEWLIEGYVPKKEITVMAGDGGVGKTFVWCAIAAAISSGSKPFLLNNIVPDGVEREPQKVMYFSSEDSNEAV